jgi:hypothetical protein
VLIWYPILNRIFLIKRFNKGGCPYACKKMRNRLWKDVERVSREKGE